jgi:hypothetical protein
MKKLIQAGMSLVLMLTLALGMTACFTGSGSSSNNKPSNDGSNWGNGHSSNTNQTNDAQGNGDSDSNTGQTVSGTSWPAGTYEVGKDIPAGEYVIITNSKEYSMFQISTDSSLSVDSTVAMDLFKNRTIVTVNEGEFLDITIGTLYPINEAPAVPSTGILPEGTYKVGLDLPAGQYTLNSTNSSYQGYYEVNSNSRHTFDGIIRNDQFTGTVTVTVSDGQYLILSFAELVR